MSTDPSFVISLYTVTAVNTAGLSDELDGGAEYLTLFAPTNSAFSKLPTGLVAKLLKPIWKPQLVDLLQYHLLSDEVLSPFSENKYFTLNEESIVIKNGGGTVPVINKSARMVQKDLPASNGYLNVIDTVLTPTSVNSNVVDIALGDDDLSTLVTALGTADLIDTLDGAGPFTVFGELFLTSSISLRLLYFLHFLTSIY